MTQSAGDYGSNHNSGNWNRVSSDEVFESEKATEEGCLKKLSSF